MVGPLDYATLRIGNYYNYSRNALSNSLVRISSGIKYHAPKDGIPEYMSVQRIRRDRDGYEIVKKDLGSALSMMDFAEHVGMQIVDNFKRLKEITYDYWDAEPGSSTRTYLENEFNGIVMDIVNLRDNAVFERRDLMQSGTVLSIMLNPNDLSQTLDIAYTANDIVDTSTLAVDAGADYDATIAVIDVEFNKAMSYLSKTSGYLYSINSQLSITDSILENNSALESTINDIDDADELKQAVTYDIRQQASLSMISQANMLRMGVLRLLEFQ